ncbi:MBL fold metallo-hydrolase [Pseudodesulfovibrio cashew]|uniref:MBL fold metallo-hydrolase n=1 Tax=Pseudodesulfovibrio cashew TaxID=2678688 RepID=A0A6I6JCN6_9BACT|nr:MBL fold metallo-hydrolase [Pseudodesulfovibrio cashew]QGY40575.1 MBL fold metallo-hydrolase [Pseudodesulfovibrio cashew]
MRFRFRGTRGSLPAPGPDTVRYGGNTACVEVRSDSGDLIILDAGTGIRGLGLELARSMPVEAHLFISHTHWDHIQGLPFFVPLFVQGNRLIIHGPPDPIAMAGIETVLAKQMEYPHFPVRVAELEAEIVYETLREGQTVDLGFAKVTASLLNHPAMNFGFRIECDGKSLFYTGDHERFYNIYEPGDEPYGEYERIVRERNEMVVDAVRGVDVLIADSQYTEEEYRVRRGWGHSTYRQALQLARDAEVGRLYMTHHEITRTDDELDAVLASLRDEWADSGIEFAPAREGDDVSV